MFSKVITKSPSVFKLFQRNSAYYCFNPYVPIIPACYWSLLSNGIRVITEQTCSSLACVTMLIDTGSKLEVPCNNGITHFIERMAFSGFRGGYKRACLEERMRIIGARLMCKTTREYQVFSAISPPEYCDEMLDVFANILTNLDCDDIENVRADVYQEKVDMENDQKKLCFEYLHRAAYQGTPMCLPILGPYENYLRFTPDYVRNYIKETYVPDKIILTCSSTWSHAQLVDMVTQHLGHLTGKSCVQQPSPARFTGAQIIYRQDDLPFSHTALAVEVPGYSSGLSHDFRVLAEVLGSWEKSQGTGYEIWPETAQYAALADSCESYQTFYIPYRDTGLFGVYFVAANGKDLDDVVWNMQTHFVQLCCSIVYTDAGRAQNRIRIELAKEVEGCVNSCLDMALQVNFFQVRKNLCAQWEALSYRSAQDLQDIAMQFLWDRCVACASIGATESLTDYTRMRSGMFWHRV